MTSPRRDQASAIRAARKRARDAATGRISSSRSDTAAQHLTGGAAEPRSTERTGRGDFIVKVISPAGPPRKMARRGDKIASPKALDERVMELERKVDLLRTGGILQPICSLSPEAAERYYPVSATLVHCGEFTSHPGRIIRSMDSPRESQAPREPAPYKLDGPLDRSRMTVKATDPATLSKERGRTILTRFGLDPDTEEE